MRLEPSRQATLYQRLRRPATQSTVLGSLPVLFFGDLLTARIATLGLNPSDQEYLSRTGVELDGAARRFETLGSLDAKDRGSLTDEQCDRAIQRMRGYFQAKGTVYAWFRSLDRVCRGIGYSYESGEVAHLDIVQEATRPTWSALARTRPDEHQALREADLPFLLWEVENFPLQAIVCNGRTPFDTLGTALGVTVVETGTLERLRWWVGRAAVRDRSAAIAGWNIPLSQATGLTTLGHHELGVILGTRLRSHGLL